MAVDSLEYDGVSCRTVSGWKHSSTKTILAGVISLKSRSSKQNQFLYISIGSGAAFYFSGLNSIHLLLGQFISPYFS